MGDEEFSKLLELQQGKKPKRFPHGGLIVLLVFVALFAASWYGDTTSQAPIIAGVTPPPSASPSVTVLPPVKLDDSGTFHTGDYVQRIRGAKPGSVVAHLTVRKLDLFDYPVRYGVGLDVLAVGPGLYPGSAEPGEGNFSMAGHRITPVGPFRTCSTGEWGTEDCHGPFRYVDTLGRGDVARVHFEGQTYVYSFVRTLVIDPDDVSILKDGKADMTFTACHPPGYATERIVAQWKLVRVK